MLLLRTNNRCPQSTVEARLRGPGSKHTMLAQLADTKSGGRGQQGKQYPKVRAHARACRCAVAQAGPGPSLYAAAGKRLGSGGSVRRASRSTSSSHTSSPSQLASSTGSPSTCLANNNIFVCDFLSFFPNQMFGNSLYNSLVLVASS